MKHKYQKSEMEEKFLKGKGESDYDFNNDILFFNKEKGKISREKSPEIDGKEIYPIILAAVK